MSTPSPLTPPEGVPAEVWARLAKQVGARWAIDERNAAGEVIGTAYRDATGKDKTSAPRSKRGLIVAWPLHNYAGSSAADPILVCEGASDTAAMMGLGFDAVGVPMTGHCGEMLAELLADRHVVIVADADEPGRRGALKIAAALLPRCASVRIIEPPEGKKDARDAVIAGANREAFIALANAAAPLKAERCPIHGAPVVLCMSDVEARPVRWVWPGRIPQGRLSLLVGRPGEGKSMLTMDWAALVTTGQPWPDGQACAGGSVVLVSGEDDPHEVIRPRLDAHGARVDRVHLLQAVVRVGKDGSAAEAMFTLADILPLEVLLERLPDCALVVIDPIGSFIGGEVDAHRENEVRGVLAPLAALAQRTGAAILLVAHQRKGAASHADDLVLGSRAFTGIARSVLHLMLDPDDSERRLLLPGKMNLSRPAAGLAFTIDGDPPRVRWEADPVAMTADGVLAAQAAGDGGERTQPDEAADWLRDFLRDGPQLAKDVFRESKEAGFSKRTIERAKSQAGVVSHKAEFGGGWVWALPQSRQTQSEDRQVPAVGGLQAKPVESGMDRPKDATPEDLASFDGPSGDLGNPKPATDDGSDEPKSPQVG